MEKDENIGKYVALPNKLKVEKIPDLHRGLEGALEDASALFEQGDSPLVGKVVQIEGKTELKEGKLSRSYQVVGGDEERTQLCVLLWRYRYQPRFDDFGNHSSSEAIRTYFTRTAKDPNSLMKIVGSKPKISGPILYAQLLHEA